MKTQTPATPIIKIIDPKNGGVLGYQVGPFFAGIGRGYPTLSGNGPGGFSPGFGMIDLRTTAPPEPPKATIATETAQ